MRLNLRNVGVALATATVAAVIAGCGGGYDTPAPPDNAALPAASANPDSFIEQMAGAMAEARAIAAANPDILAEQMAGEMAEASALAAGNPVSILSAALLPVPISENSAVRFLNQATFGSTEAEIATVQMLGREGWLQAQFALPVGRTMWDSVKADQAAWLNENPDLPVPLAVWDWSVWEAYMSAPDQLRKRVGYALSQIVVVSVPSLAGNAENRSLQGAGFLDVLETGAFGNFRQLIEDVSLNPAMGFYLSHRGNQKAEYPDNDSTKPPLRVPDENYAREVMQLFTIGLVELNLDGTAKLDDNGLPRATYTEADVQGLARVFTGWNWTTGSDPGNLERFRKPMKHIAAHHAPEAKQFLGVTIPAGTDGPTSLHIALDTLFNHPNTAPFISKQLIQRLVTSNPSPAYVKRVAARFVNNGQNVRGDMKAVIEAVLLDAEAKFEGPTKIRGKLREPVLRYTTFARAFGVSNGNNGEIWRVGATTDPATGLGQSPLRAPSVFNFYRPGYVPPKTRIASRGLVAPEFQITTDTSLPGYVNFMRLQLISPTGGLTYDYSGELLLAANPTALVDRLNRKLTNGAMSEATREEIKTTVGALPVGTPAQDLARVRTAILMTLAAPEFIVQK
jgi:uncharacterized protein (DUF1800 family)